jgi:calcium/calmodulin-dependent protein kinase I
VVRLAKNASTGQDVAIKCITRKDLSPEDEQSIRSEINIMKALDHPNIVKFVDSFEEEKFFYVVLEFLPGGELFDRLVQKTFYTEKEARDTVRVICEGIKYCHDRGIVHRDLKPENLLMASVDDDANVKIADFGFATRAVGASLTVACGTPGYVAPELVSNKPYGKAVDMWAIGVITYCLLGGYPPFDAETDKLLFRKIRKGEYEFHPQFWNHISSEGKAFIASLLQLDPEVRATADDALAHPWVRPPP